MTSSTDASRARELGAARHLERDLRSVGQRPLGADDALRDRRLGDEERARDLVGRQAAEQAQRERDARLGRQHRMAGGEHEPQQVVADVVVAVAASRSGIGACCSLSSSWPSSSCLRSSRLLRRQMVDRAMLRGAP